MVSTRQTAAERRVAVLSAAVTEFAKSGYAGTSTDAIAARAGISQPYLFRLFGTKKDLFIATYDQVGIGSSMNCRAPSKARTAKRRCTPWAWRI